MVLIKIGKYQHFRGGIYEVIGLAKHSETLEELVIYRGEQGDLWARPTINFLATIKIDNQEVPRFRYLG